MRALGVLLLAFICAGITQGAKKARNMNQLTKKVNKLATMTANANTRLGVLTRTSFANNNPIVVVDATIGSGTNKCGPQTITGWTEVLDKYYTYAASTTLSTTTSFNPTTGTFTPPVTGYYKICVSFRARNTGNAVDVTIQQGGSRVAALGSALQTDWRSLSTCTIQQLTATTGTVTVRLESGGGSDCIEETGWFYSRFSAHLIACVTNNCA